VYKHHAKADFGECGEPKSFDEWISTHPMADQEVVIVAINPHLVSFMLVVGVLAFGQVRASGPISE